MSDKSGRKILIRSKSLKSKIVREMQFPKVTISTMLLVNVEPIRGKRTVSFEGQKHSLRFIPLSGYLNVG